jgi:hypothetical protein
MGCTHDTYSVYTDATARQLSLLILNRVCVAMLSSRTLLRCRQDFRQHRPPRFAYHCYSTNFTTSLHEDILDDLAAGAESWGAQLHVTLASSHHGRCLQFADSGYIRRVTQEGTDGAERYVRVPVSMVLSDEVPGCCQEAAAFPQLDDVIKRLKSYPEHDRWELRLAAMLLWAVRQESHTSVGAFWARWEPLSSQSSMPG